MKSKKTKFVPPHLWMYHAPYKYKIDGHKLVKNMGFGVGAPWETIQTALDKHITKPYTADGQQLILSNKSDYNLIRLMYL